MIPFINEFMYNQGWNAQSDLKSNFWFKSKIKTWFVKK